MKNVLEEQQQIVREFSDDEDEQPTKPKKPIKEEIFESKEEQAYQEVSLFVIVYEKLQLCIHFTNIINFF